MPLNANWFQVADLNSMPLGHPDDVHGRSSHQRIMEWFPARRSGEPNPRGNRSATPHQRRVGVHSPDVGGRKVCLSGQSGLKRSIHACFFPHPFPSNR